VWVNVKLVTEKKKLSPLCFCRVTLDQKDPRAPWPNCPTVCTFCWKNCKNTGTSGSCL
jgi:hypothetical protein